MWRMFGFLLIFVTGYYAEDQRGIKWCLKYTQCREVYVESGKFRQVFVSKCAHSIVIIEGTLKVAVRDMEGHQCRKKYNYYFRRKLYIKHFVKSELL